MIIQAAAPRVRSEPVDSGAIRSPLSVGLCQPLEQVREPTVNEQQELQIFTGLYTFVSGYVYGCA